MMLSDPQCSCGCLRGTIFVEFKFVAEIPLLYQSTEIEHHPPGLRG
jgi:hypothetical protein